ncbi:MAG: hydrogenase maturation protease [Terriglobia bacterium]
MISPVRQARGDRGAAKAAPCLRVVGLGNAFAGDDSVGLEIVNRLRAREECDYELLALPQAGVELIDALENIDAVLFIDAVSSGSPPGTLHLVPLPCGEVASRALSSLSSHGWGLAEALELMAALGRPIPRLALLGVEIATVEAGRPRSPAVETAIETVVERFPAIHAFLAAAEKTGWAGPLRFAPDNAAFAGL